MVWGYVFGALIASSAVSYTRIYPTQAARDALAAAYGANKATSALFGPAPQLQTVAGFTAFKISMTLLLLGAVWGLLTSTRLLRGEEDDGRWELLLAGQTTRRRAAAQALAGLGAGACALWALTAILTVGVGLDSSVRIAARPALYFALAMTVTAVMFLAVGALASQLASTRRQAASYAAAFLGGCYALRMIADAGVGLHGLIWASPLGWAEQLRPFAGPQPLALLPIAAFTAVLAVAAIRLAGLRDAGAGILADRARAAPRLRLLSGPAGLAIRLARPTVLGWWTAIALSALLFGLIARSAGSTIAGSSAQGVLAKLGASGSGTDAVLGVCFLVLAVLIAFAAAGQVTAARAEESSGRLDHLLVRPGLAVALARRQAAAGGGRAARGRRRGRPLRLARRGQPALGHQPGDAARGRPQPRAARHRHRRHRRARVRRLAPAHGARRLHRARLVGAGRHRRRLRRLRPGQPLDARHLGLPPDGVGPGDGAELDRERHHGRHRRRLRPARRHRLQPTRPGR